MLKFFAFFSGAVLAGSAMAFAAQDCPPVLLTSYTPSVAYLTDTPCPDTLGDSLMHTLQCRPCSNSALLIADSALPPVPLCLARPAVNQVATYFVLPRHLKHGTCVPYTAAARVQEPPANQTLMPIARRAAPEIVARPSWARDTTIFRTRTEQPALRFPAPVARPQTNTSATTPVTH